MTNAEKFKQLFGIYATELWAMPEEKFLEWLNAQALEQREKDRWIPVTDRLPEEDCSCRVTEGDFKSVIDCCWNNHKKQFEVWSYYHDDYVPITNVTAWKPIEEPYTEEEHDNS